MKTRFILLPICILLLLGCRHEADQTVTPASGPANAVSSNQMSFEIDGQKYQSSDITSTGSPSLFSFWGIVKLSNSSWIDLKITLYRTSPGTYRAINTDMLGSYTLFKSAKDFDAYEFWPGDDATVTLTSYVPGGTAVGTFSFTAKNVKGQKVQIKNGSFKFQVPK